MPDLEPVVGQKFHQLAGQELPVPPAEAVMRRGRQRRRRARGRAISAIAAAAAAITAIAVSQLAAAPAAHRPPASRGRHAPGGRALGCPAAQSTLLATALTTSPLPISRQQSVWPIAISRNGSALYTQTTTQGFTGIVEENLHTGAILATITPLPSSYTGSQGGIGPRNALVWTSTYPTHSELGSITPVQMWSPAVPSVTNLEPAGQNGAVLSTPVFSSPGNEFAAWEVADGSRQEIAEADLSTGVSDVIARGYLGPPVFVGDALVWSVASKPGGQQSTLVAANAAAFPATQPMPVPVSLRAASETVVTRFGQSGPWQPEPSLIASYGTAVVYASTDLTKLYYSPAASQPARLVLTLTGGNTVSPGSLFAGPGYIGWGTAYATSYLASTSSFAVAPVVNGTTVWGDVQGFGNDVLVGTFKPTKKQHLTRFHLVSASTVKALRCAAGR
jgi:hypothetical protein